MTGAGKPGGLSPVLTAALLAGCSAKPTGACGESFCLPADARVVEILAPVEDFKFYRIEWREQSVEIYEGNQPKERAEATSNTAVELPIDPKAVLRTYDLEGSILVHMGRDWPAFLEVMGPCPAVGDCPVATFAKELRRR
jgi:hypothetical protein